MASSTQAATPDSLRDRRNQLRALLREARWLRRSIVALLVVELGGLTWLLLELGGERFGG